MASKYPAKSRSTKKYNNPRAFESSTANRRSRASMEATSKGVASVRKKAQAERVVKGKASKADPFKPSPDAAQKAATARAVAKPAAERPVPTRAGVKKGGAVSERIRGAEWAMKDAQRRANNRAKARKNPTGRIGQALAKKGYNAANAAEAEGVKKRTQAAGKKYVAPRRGGGAKSR